MHLQAVRSLYHVARPDTLRALAPWISDPTWSRTKTAHFDSFRRHEVMKNLGKVRVPEAIPHLIEGLKIGESHDRAVVATALADLYKVREAGPTLRAALDANLGHDKRMAMVRATRARELYGAKRKPTIFAQIADYAEIKALVNVGRMNDARERLAAKGAVPDGDYLQHQHWIAELYVMFADGKHELSDDELFARARVGLTLTVGVPLLGLTAWAHHVSGDDEQAWHLLGEALDRVDEHTGIEQTMPLLHAWMQECAALAEAAWLKR